MKAYIAWLVLLAGLSIVLQPVAAVKFSIHVLDNGKPVENAYIRILDGTNLVKNGNSDSNGLFVVYLNRGKYTIRAQHYDKSDEKKDHVLDSSESEVFLNLH